MHIEFAICAETMDLNRTFADAEFQGDLTIEFAFGDQKNDIALAFRQQSVALFPLRFQQPEPVSSSDRPFSTSSAEIPADSSFLSCSALPALS